jgi:23S rRNA (uracil1939-C5)-methyltransferase
MKRDEELVLDIEDFAAGGKSVARVDGRVVFVPLTLPGDRVKARVRSVKKKFVEAEPLEVLRESPRRVSPKCMHFGVCGGCRWQHASYEAQLEFKRQQVADGLERIGGFRDLGVAPVLGSKDVYFYRNKMEFSFGPAWLDAEAFGHLEKGETGPETLALGLHPSGLFSKVLDLKECSLQSPLSNRILGMVRRFAVARRLDFYSTRTHSGYLRALVVREGKKTGDVMVNIVTSDDRPGVMQELRDALRAECPEVTTFVNNITSRKSQVAVGEYERVYFGPGYITEGLGGKTFRVSPNSFFQTNTAQAERLYEIASRLAELQPDDVVYDLYSGTGTIAIVLADRVLRVVGVEAVEAAVLDARGNAELNNASNCFFEIGDLKEKMTREREWIERHGPPSVVILDPPRSGAHEKVIREILKFAPERIAYISCNPATQARDLRLLCADGRYGITEVQPVDMFPHTEHIECVVGLKRSAAG